MKPGHRSRVWWLVAAAPLLSIGALVANCASSSRALRAASASKEGVRVAIRDHECLPNRDPTGPNDEADLVVNLEIHNPLSTPVVIQKGAMQVVDTEGGIMRRRGTAQRAPVEIAAGASQQLEMHFLGSPDHCCSSRLALSPSGVTTRDRVISIQPIDFVPFCLF
jgi:hypothetical protein